MPCVYALGPITHGENRATAQQKGEQRAVGSVVAQTKQQRDPEKRRQKAIDKGEAEHQNMCCLHKQTEYRLDERRERRCKTHKNNAISHVLWCWWNNDFQNVLKILGFVSRCLLNHMMSFWGGYWCRHWRRGMLPYDEKPTSPWSAALQPSIDVSSMRLRFVVPQ